ncbi:MAG: uroporphyrinogen-III synthase [Desulfurococcales archaeon]|nr:uroporphyrinogen-III synthase [Desulfurococcales archaeon]
MQGGCRLLFMGPDSPPRGPGYEAVWIPLIAVEPVEGSSRELLSQAGPGDVIVFTSPRAPRILALDAVKLGIYNDIVELVRRSTVGVVGPSTLKSLNSHLGKPRSIVMPPSGYTVRALASTLASMNPGRVVAARASRASPILREVLASGGVELVEVTVYRNEPLPGNAAVAASLIAGGTVDYALFTSPMQATLVAPKLHEPKARLAAIGPETGRVLEAHGLRYAMPREYTLESLISATTSRCNR